MDFGGCWGPLYFSSLDGIILTGRPRLNPGSESSSVAASVSVA